MGDIKNYQMLINGDWVDASDGGVFDSVNKFSHSLKQNEPSWWDKRPFKVSKQIVIQVEKN